MAESRPLPCNFWSWPRIVDLLLDQKAIAAYLFTNRFTTACGCYELPRRLVAGELGLTPAVLEEALRQFCYLELVAVDEASGELFVLDWFRFHKFSTGAQLVNFWRSKDKIQSTKLRKLVVEKSHSAGVPLTKLNAKTTLNQKDESQHQHQHQRQQNLDYEARKAASVAQTQIEANRAVLRC
jgi:hypothetical protein